MGNKDLRLSVCLLNPRPVCVSQESCLAWHLSQVLHFIIVLRRHLLFLLLPVLSCGAWAVRRDLWQVTFFAQSVAVLLLTPSSYCVPSAWLGTQTLCGHWSRAVESPGFSSWERCGERKAEESCCSPGPGSFSSHWSQGTSLVFECCKFKRIYYDWWKGFFFKCMI